ncbi:hypothetical protein FNV58_01275 (plasmid) [Streptomyces sp. RLB1-9]|uniref:hypothetical protein n=1 Tax=Streptomyces sp. RLB1-9 TaxID=2594454 RepID=UPI00116386B2|nr:hypothetical protein [Streptomyces sp. RLB1-9]QDN94993.1 hypothetical protein FNV58_01275 [Streptomyces sp. RLB1-9]
MRRKSLQPWPETVWYTSGRVKNSSSLRAIRQRLQQEPFQHWREFTPSDDPKWWWGFDASWRTEDGDRIKARLELQPDLTAASILNLSKKKLDTSDVNIEFCWRLTAEADSPWRLDWQSPMTMFGDVRPYDWVSGRMPLVDYTYAKEVTPQECSQMFSAMSAASWYITVITHDKTPIDKVVPEAEPTLGTYLPPSLRGRVVEVRVFGDQDQIVNAHEVLPESRLRLKWGGALILPTNPRQEEWCWADYSVRRPSGGNMEQLLKETAEAVTRYAALRPHYGGATRWCVKDLRETWMLPEIQVAPKRILQEKDQAVERTRELEQALVDLQGVVDDERKMAERARKARDDAESRLQELRAQPLAQQAREAERQAQEAWAASEVSDGEVERLTGEVGWLRRQLAQVPGRAYGEPVPEPAKGPESWQELLELAPELLEHVQVLDSVRAPLQKLYGHASSGSWLRRTWDTLEALNAYVAAKKEHGSQVLPHFATYLEWPQATDLIPRTWFRPSEVSLERTGSSWKQTRMFEVPGLGEVFMGLHVRIGQGSGGLAPRMHFYDDTCGPTEKVHVGYIGPHLPNWKGR